MLERYYWSFLMLIILSQVIKSNPTKLEVHNQYQMGANTAKIKDILYVTGESLDPHDLHHDKVNNPHKEVHIDYTTYKPKKFYKQDATDQQVQAHLKEVKKKQQVLRQFKYYQDFDRIDFKRMRDQITFFQIFSEEWVKISVISSFVFARLVTIYSSKDYFTVASSLRLVFPMVFASLPIIGLRMATSPQYHIINHEYYRLLPEFVSEYINFDQKLDLYKDVEDIKYNFKYPSRRDFYKTRRDVLDRQQAAKKAQYLQYHQYELGLKKEPLQEYAFKRQKQRVGNWQILTKQEKQIIKKQIEDRAQREQQSTP